MSSPQPQLLASCWTSAGDVMPARGPDHSPLPIRTRIEAVAAAGYVGFGSPGRTWSGRGTPSGSAPSPPCCATTGSAMSSWSGSPTGGPAGPARGVGRGAGRPARAAPILGVDHIKVGADDAGVPVGYDGAV